MVSFVRDLDIHIFSQQGSQIAKVKEVFSLAQEILQSRASELFTKICF